MEVFVALLREKLLRGNSGPPENLEMIFDPSPNLHGVSPDLEVLENSGQI